MDATNPDYYRVNGIEVGDICGELPYWRGNAVKYLVRAGKKTPDPLTDLRKAAVCIEKEINRLCGGDVNDG